MAKKSKSKSRSKSSKRVLNALEIAERELEGSASDGDSDNYNPRKNGTVVNLLKKSERRNESDSDVMSDGSFEDEELDSDEALDSGDELGKLGKEGDVDVDNLSDGGYTSIEEGELMSLSQIWDMDSTKTKQSKGDKNVPAEDEDTPLKFQDSDIESSDEESGSEGSSDDEGEDDESSDDPFDEISEDDEDIELKTITSNLLKDASKNSSKRLATYGTGEENEYILPSIKENEGTQKLSLSDMMNIVDDKQIIEKATLLKGEGAATAIPLPQRIQQRNERKAAYEISKDEVSRWSDVVKQNRRAEHLSFPMNQKVEHQEASVFTTSVSENTSSSLQDKVRNVLEQSNLVDPEKEATFEDLHTAKMTPEEMKKRTVEMRLMRDLMFREERKARRIKKIKSKAYHRVKNKEIQRNREKAGISDESDTELDIARAKERMTLKHKTNSKWAKDMIKHGMTNDAETRDEMEEMLRQGERLKAKIQDRNSDDEDERKGLSDIETEQVDEVENTKMKDVLGKTGVMNMAFMRNAEAREKEANLQNIANIRAFENGEDPINSDADHDENIQLNRGRRVYVPSNLIKKKEAEEADEELKEEIRIDNSRNLSNRLNKNTLSSKSANGHDSDAANETVGGPQEPANPWLVGSDDESNKNVKRSTKVSIVDKDSSKETKRTQKIEKKLAKQDRKNKKDTSNDDGELLLDSEISNKLNIVDPYGGSDNEFDGEFSFKQQDVIADAFAGDDVIAEFENEKKRVADDDDDKEEDVTLPGWGDWAGSGTQPRMKRSIKKIKGVVQKDKRKDRRLQNVIINEKINKKNLKYQSSAVPFPFENKEQYERSLRMPLGQQWTSRKSHQNLIKPRIMTKPGEVIDPLKAPFK
ncbi:similar to Saccharomyces cerevisiae YML093W UTP14 Subunit of U3-containing Small Subunit (SSU) processome complex involved in production of 18S rRNA and assembly of small ribosomal subunit [Maudiozyma barnettii]|uniref:Similar to Saccharomyces cerevisiae YML093W UTP14 Subunit of U3-containing Small Subunit (SSU) processome complex involved in production of 18S rRNA and assembly of small ribosomal subunit n=1 Tax=Maudiozyma barnettii TaxID=61262 RepID=A0A8H2VC70_9SACH|nr:Utp14p [Kazachstania barnettii]CAB4252607.1 similar to Saccharomyces cerevisiae YML093W UTP14 Subunit of U3-containing Small Subunit (SSU) processome complex involved in production of 18S rRNA and assembly of small ribosomal subunit [Kazachstania barnettii]CAD1780053.1 similar to Saccharomyces cerevisiae YML093W UTP14 Subunit of U3-containing Small Subunit (SSU) processome complex involved in production of 18S rRNA and assembly of small ribosomal subunit [Kazachstania barnettii]